MGAPTEATRAMKRANEEAALKRTEKIMAFVDEKGEVSGGEIGDLVGVQRVANVVSPLVKRGLLVVRKSTNRNSRGGFIPMYSRPDYDGPRREGEIASANLPFILGDFWPSKVKLPQGKVRVHKGAW
jgi:hypothetical protein